MGPSSSFPREYALPDTQAQRDHGDNGGGNKGGVAGLHEEAVSGSS